MVPMKAEFITQRNIIRRAWLCAGGLFVACMPVEPLFGEMSKKPIVVGLVISMQRQEDRVTTPFEEKTVYMPLGLAVAVQAPFIRETIDLWFKQNVSP